MPSPVTIARPKPSPSAPGDRKRPDRRRRRPRRPRYGCRQRAQAAALVLEHGGLAHWSVRTVLGIGPDSMSFDDAIAVALAAMWRAGLKFDPRRGVPFPAVAGVYMRHELWRFAHYAVRHGFGHTGDRTEVGARPAKPPEQPASLTSTFSDRTDDDRTIAEIIESPLSDPADLVTDAIDAVALWRFAFDVLPSREFWILRDRFVGGLTFPEIGEKLGVSRQYVEQLQRAALWTLQRAIRREGRSFGVGIGVVEV